MGGRSAIRRDSVSRHGRPDLAGKRAGAITEVLFCKSAASKGKEAEEKIRLHLPRTELAISR